jgi:hypothetical protein
MRPPPSSSSSEKVDYSAAEEEEEDEAAEEAEREDEDMHAEPESNSNKPSTFSSFPEAAKPSRLILREVYTPKDAWKPVFRRDIVNRRPGVMQPPAGHEEHAALHTQKECAALIDDDPEEGRTPFDRQHTCGSSQETLPTSYTPTNGGLLSEEACVELTEKGHT